MRRFLSVLLAVVMLAGCIAPSLVTFAAGELAVVSVPETDTGLQGDTSYKTTLKLADTPVDLIYIQAVVFWATDAGVSEVNGTFDSAFDPTNSSVSATALGSSRTLRSALAPYGANTADYTGCLVDVEGKDVFGARDLCELEFVFDSAMDANATFEYYVAIVSTADGNDAEAAFDDTKLTSVVTFEADPYLGLYNDPTLFIVSENAEVEAGAQAKIDVRVDSNPGIWGGLYALTYPEGWTIASDTCGKVFPDKAYECGNYDEKIADKLDYLKDRLASFPDTPVEGYSFVTAYFESEGTYDFNSENGVLVSYVFNVPADAAPASTHDFSIIYDKEGDFLKVDPGESGDVYNHPVFDVVGLTLTIAGEPAAVCDHTNTYDDVKKEATCTETGLKDVICSDCGEIVATDVEIPALGHTEEEMPAVEATCTEAGSTAGVKCSVCGEILKAPEVITALGHTEEEIPAVEATCTEAGSTVGVKCSVCGEILTAPEEISAKGHAWDNGEETKAPTEEDSGVITYTCERCGATYDETIPPIEHVHDYVYTETVDATCTEDGYDIYTCRCGLTETRNIITAPGHTEEEIPAVEATCNEAGSTAGVKCSVCGEILVAPEVIPALGHTEEEIPAVEATCTEAGSTAGVKCSACGEILVAPEVIPALGHTEEEIPAVEATCTEAGSTAGVKCSVCEVILKAPEEIPAKGHTEEEIPAVEATCTEAGSTAGVKCSVCGEILVAPEEISAKGHTEEEIPAVEATCTEAGSTAGVKCSVCGEILTAPEVITAPGHTEVEIPAVEATCTEAGSTAGVKCSVCGEILVAPEVITAKGHTEEEIPAVEATCTEAGSTAGVKCSVCEVILKAPEVITAPGHTAGGWEIIVPPGDGVVGIRVKNCVRCGIEMFRETISPVSFITRVAAREKVASIMLNDNRITVVSKDNAAYVTFTVVKTPGMMVTAENAKITGAGANFAYVTVKYPVTNAKITVADRKGNFKEYSISVTYSQKYYTDMGVGYTAASAAEENGIITVTAKKNQKEACFYLTIPYGNSYEASEGLTVVVDCGKVYVKAYVGTTNTYTFTITAANGAKKTYTVNYVFDNKLELLGVSGGYMIKNGGTIAFNDAENTVNITVKSVYDYASFRFKFADMGCTVTCNDSNATTAQTLYTYVKVAAPAEGNTVTTTVTLANEAMGTSRVITVNVTFVD